MFMNATLLRLRNVQPNQKHTPVHTESSSDISIKIISDIFKYHDGKNAESTLALSEPLIFTLLKKNDVDKDTYVAVVTGGTDDLKTLRTIRYEGTAKDDQKPLQKPYGVFSGYALYPEDRHLLEEKKNIDQDWLNALLILHK